MATVDEQFLEEMKRASTWEWLRLLKETAEKEQLIDERVFLDIVKDARIILDPNLGGPMNKGHLDSEDFSSCTFGCGGHNKGHGRCSDDENRSTYWVGPGR